MRAAPVAGVLLTDAEIDHTAGLLLLRESSTPLRVYGSEAVRRALTDGYPVLRDPRPSYSGVEWRTLEPGAAVALDGSSLEVESFAAGGDAPRYFAGTAEVEASGLVVPRPLDRRRADLRARASRGSTTTCSAASAASDVVLVDGTFWRDDELARLGISDAHRARRWATCRSPARTGRWRRSRGSSARA